jgi:hypothetical protein
VSGYKHGSNTSIDHRRLSVHVLHLPPRHLWSTTVLAALVALLAALIIWPTHLGTGTSSSSASAAPGVQLRGPLPPPVWLSRPLANPVLELGGR